MTDFGKLTIRHAQMHQPWTLTYSQGVYDAENDGAIPHILGTHVSLHVSKTAGKIAAVFEALDHGSVKSAEQITYEQLSTLRDMAGDLVIEAMRLANLYNFDLATQFVRRVAETNSKVMPPWD